MVVFFETLGSALPSSLAKVPGGPKLPQLEDDGHCSLEEPEVLTSSVSQLLSHLFPLHDVVRSDITL